MESVLTKEEVQAMSYKELQKTAQKFGYEGKIVGGKTKDLRDFLLTKAEGGDTTPDPSEPESKEGDTNTQESNEDEGNTPTEKPKTRGRASAKPEEGEKVAKTRTYQGVAVVGMSDRIISGRLYRDVTVATGETYTLTTDEFDRDVK